MAQGQTKKPDGGNKVLLQNRRARHDYHVEDTVEAGIVLVGSEVKSLREGRAQLTDAYAQAEKGEMMLLQMQISEYPWANRWNHEPKRPRKLLLHKREIDKLAGSSQIKGLALPILRMYWKDQRVKVELCVGKGKDFADQRQDLKAKVEKREAQRVVKGFNEKHGR